MQLGAHTVTFRAADTGTPMGVASMDVTIAVGQAANRPPVLAPIGNQQLDPGQALAFTLSAQDPEGQPLVFSATGLPTGASLVGPSFAWTPDSAQIGQHSMTFKVTDAGTPTRSPSTAPASPPTRSSPTSATARASSSGRRPWRRASA